MTKKKFKEAMKRGLGRCVLELQNTSLPEKYQDIVLWGCTRNLAYDVQSEGTRAAYIYELIQYFPDKTPFLQKIVKHFQKYRSSGNWDFAHDCRLLSFFAADGSREALTALWRRYDSLYQDLWERKPPRENGAFPERDDFEELGIDLVDCANDAISVYLKIAEDIGNLYLAGTFDTGWDFRWFHDCCESNYGGDKITAALEKRAGESCAAAEYWKRMQSSMEGNDSKQEKSAERTPRTPEEYCRALTKETEEWEARRFGRKISGEEKLEMRLELARNYLAEQELWKRNLILKVFTYKNAPFPLSPEAVAADARSENEELKRTAFEALGNIRHELARESAFALLREGGHEKDVIPMLAKNYREEDRELFTNLVYGVPISYGAYNIPMNWHGIFSTVLDMFEEGGAENPPEELLPYLYETTLCSFCRKYVVEEMERRHMVSEEMMRECLYDSSEDIRNYAQKWLDDFKNGQAAEQPDN